MKPIISFRDFSFRYDSQTQSTLKNITVDIYPGEKILILGPSGSGKSTFGKCLNGLIPHAFIGEWSGELTLFNEDLSHLSIDDLSRYVGTVLQDTSAQFVGMTVAEDMAFALENDATSHSVMHEAVQNWASRMHLSDLLNQAPGSLSGGQKQRVSMSGVLIDSPQVLLFDEPLASLDPASGYETMTLIEKMHRQLETTVIIIEHRLEEVLSQPVDRVLLFDEGRIIFDGTPRQLLLSNYLIETHIREPLYISALKYAGVNLNEVTSLESLSQLEHPTLCDQLTSWSEQIESDPPRQKTASLLTIENMSFSYKNTDYLTLQSVNLTIEEGEMVSLVGTNGAGKSTLAKVIAGFLTPTRGQLIWREENMTQDSIKQRAERIGYVMQDPNQMISQHLIFDEVALGLRLRGYSEEDVKQKVYDTLKVCGLYPFRHWPISALSYGQKKRVTIAAILVLKPELLILDEPTAGQDYYHYTEFMMFMKELNRQGMTILMITHDMQLMLEYTQRTIVIHDGQVIGDETPFVILGSKELVDKASLRETSLYTLARQCGVEVPETFVQKFMTYEERKRENG